MRIFWAWSWNPHIAAGVETPLSLLDGEVDNPISTELCKNFADAVGEFLEFNRRFPIDLIAGTNRERGDLEALTDIIGTNLGCSYMVKQDILEHLISTSVRKSDCPMHDEIEIAKMQKGHKRER